MLDTEAMTACTRSSTPPGADGAGRPRQLGAVGAGRLMATAVGVEPRPHAVGGPAVQRRVEREASPAARRDADVVAEYDRRGRVLEGGDEAATVTAIARAAAADRLAGRTTLVVAPSNRLAADVAAQVRRHLVDAGVVAEHGLELGDGCTAGVGDVIQARRIDRALGLTNRETYQVTALTDDGGLDVVSLRTGEVRHVPADYRAADVTLAYAGTVHAAQGATVDTSHALVGTGMSADAAYVGMSAAATATPPGASPTAGRPGARNRPRRAVSHRRRPQEHRRLVSRPGRRGRRRLVALRRPPDRSHRGRDPPGLPGTPRRRPRPAGRRRRPTRARARPLRRRPGQRVPRPAAPRPRTSGCRPPRAAPRGRHRPAADLSRLRRPSRRRAHRHHAPSPPPSSRPPCLSEPRRNVSNTSTTWRTGSNSAAPNSAGRPSTELLPGRPRHSDLSPRTPPPDRTGSSAPAPSPPGVKPPDGTPTRRPSAAAQALPHPRSAPSGTRPTSLPGSRRNVDRKPR